MDYQYSLDGLSIHFNRYTLTVAPFNIVFRNTEICHGHNSETSSELHNRAKIINLIYLLIE